MKLPTRPIVAGFFPDPTICRVGDTYYLANSSFEYAPGLPIHRSTDLLTWEHIGNALDRPEQLKLFGAVPSGGIFAPTLRHHEGRFYLITTNLTDPAGGQLLVTAADPAGPWSDPIRIPVGGIDPDLSWDGAGTCYLTRSGFSDNGPEGIVQVVVNPDTGEVLSEPSILWQGTGGKFPEGPHLYQIGDFWYLLIAEGGTERGHCATIARSSSPSGPFEPSPHNPLVTARSTDSPVQNAGHSDLISRPDGSWALVYHGVRVRGTSPQWHVLGRETVASTVDWEDGWPKLADPIQPPAPTGSEILDAGGLPVSWIAPGRFPSEVLHPTSDGWQLHATGIGESSFVGRRQTHLNITATAAVDAASGTGGMELRVDPRHAVRLQAGGGQVQAIAQIGSVVSVLGQVAAADSVVLELAVEPSRGHEFSTEFGPDEIVARVSGPDGVTELGRLDGRYISTEVAGGMTGRVVGLYCKAGHLTIASFTYTGADEATDQPPQP